MYFVMFYSSYFFSDMVFNVNLGIFITRIFKYFEVYFFIS